MDTSDHRYPLLFCKWYWWRFNLNWKKRIPIKIIILTCTMYGAPASVPLSIQWKKYLNVCVRACVYVHVWVSFLIYNFVRAEEYSAYCFWFVTAKKNVLLVHTDPPILSPLSETAFVWSITQESARENVPRANHFTFNSTFSSILWFTVFHISFNIFSWENSVKVMKRTRYVCVRGEYRITRLIQCLPS